MLSALFAISLLFVGAAFMAAIADSLERRHGDRERWERIGRGGSIRR